MKSLIGMISIGMLCCVALPVTGQIKLRANVEEVKDTRTTSEFFVGLDITLKAIGESLHDAKAVKFTPIIAIDDLGTDLIMIPEDWESNDFQELDESSFNKGQVTVELTLRNPPRRAEYLKELSGKLEIFVPTKDDDAVTVIKDFRQLTDPAIKSEKLKKANVELSIMTAEQYEKAKQDSIETDIGESIAEGFAEAFGSIFGGLGPSAKDSVIAICNDPDSRVVAIEFLDVDGNQIDTIAHSTIDNTSTFEFEEKLPDNAQMKVYVATSKAVVDSTILVKDIALP